MSTNQDGGLFAGERLALLRSLIADDVYAMSFQSLGQYRSALLKPELAPVAQPADQPASGASNPRAGHKVWLVVDEVGQPIHCTSWREACHEHINDAINDFQVEGAEKWKVYSATYDAQPVKLGENLLRPAILAKPAISNHDDLINLLNQIKPNYGDVGTRDVDVTAQRARIDAAIAALTERKP